MTRVVSSKFAGSSLSFLLLERSSPQQGSLCLNCRHLRLVRRIVRSQLGPVQAEGLSGSG